MFAVCSGWAIIPGEKPMTKTLYFAYGANMNQDNMAWRCPQATNPRPYILRDWCLKFYTHATVEHSPGDSVWGILWDISPDCERSLDLFEGFPVYYAKRNWRQGRDRLMFYEMAQYRQGQPSRGYIEDIRSVYRYFGQPFDHLIKDLDRERNYSY